MLHYHWRIVPEEYVRRFEMPAWKSARAHGRDSDNGCNFSSFTLGYSLVLVGPNPDDNIYLLEDFSSDCTSADLGIAKGAAFLDSNRGAEFMSDILKYSVPVPDEMWDFMSTQALHALHKHGFIPAYIMSQRPLTSPGNTDKVVVYYGDVAELV